MRRFRRRAAPAGTILHLPVLDHVIVTRDPRRYHAMLDQGTLPAGEG